MIVLTGRKIPPTVAERKAAFWARIHHITRTVCTVAAVSAPFTLALALWLATRTETGWAVTIGLVSLPMFVAAVSRLTDVGPKDGEPT